MSATVGKQGRLARLADSRGVFRVLGVGAVDSLESLIRSSRPPAGPVPPAAIAPEDLQRFKHLVMTTLAPGFSAVSTDPVHGLPLPTEELPPDIGTVLSVQKPGYALGGRHNRERLAAFLPQWDSGEVLRAPVDALKLTVYVRPDSTPAVQDHQKSMAEAAGKACARAGLAFVLQVMVYPLEDEELADPRVYASHLPDLVMGNVEEFSQPRYLADLIKTDLPADLRFCALRPGGSESDPRVLYERTDIVRFCNEMSNLAGKPWVVLSGGTDLQGFIDKVKLASEGGCAGFWGGRAAWVEAVRSFGDWAEVRRLLEQHGPANAEKLSTAFTEARRFTRVP